VSGFDKFAWIRAVRASTELSDGMKYVLQNAALEYVLHEDRAKALGREAGQLYARQATIAETCQVSLRLVKSAYSAARRLGFLALAEDRQRGRGHHSPDTYRLVIPQEIGANAAPNNDKKVHETTEIGARNVEIGARADPLTSENDTITGGIAGGSEGTAPPAPPSSQCSKHRNDPNPPNCRACGDARKAAEDFARRQAEAEKQARADALARRDACTACDEFGWLLGADGTAITPAVKCTTHNQMEAV
jgi:hypothetical protein